MYLKRITLKNFRAYYGEQTLEFSPTLGHSISVVTGNNGYGKTSLLTGLLWALYGRLLPKVEESYAKDIRAKGGYENYLRELINRKAVNEGRPQLLVELLIGDFSLPYLISEEKESMLLSLTIRRTVHLIDGFPDEVLTISGNATENFDLEEAEARQKFILNYVLPVEMAKFYLFDAERVVQIADNFGSRDVQKQLAQNFEEIFGIKKYADVKNELLALHERQQKEAATFEKKTKLNELEGQTLKLTKEHEAIEAEIDRLETQRLELDQQRTELLTQVADARTYTREQYEQAKHDRDVKNGQLATFKEKLVEELTRAPMLLMARRLSEFNSHLTQELKYEEYLRQLKTQRLEADRITTKIRREFDLLNNELMKPGIEAEYVSHWVMNQFIDKVHTVLEQEFLSTLEAEPKPSTSFRKDFSDNDLAYFKRNLHEVMKGGGASRLATCLQQYRQSLNETQTLGKRVKDIEDRLESEQTSEARKKIQTLEKQLREIDESVGRCKSKLDGNQNELAKLRKQISELLGQIEGVESIEKRLAVVGQVTQSLKVFIDRYKQEKIEQVERRATEMMRRIFHKKDFITQFKIHSEGHNIRIRLLDTQHKERDFSEFSMGERQIIITALLHALIIESYFCFPVFIDSPLQKLDPQHKRGILEHFYVGLHTQTVLLPLLESELQAEEYELIRHHIDRCYLIRHEQGASRFLPVGAAQLFDTYHHLQTSPTP
jgi:DNA sulfur modification protein DndD